MNPKLPEGHAPPFSTEECTKSYCSLSHGEQIQTRGCKAYYHQKKFKQGNPLLQINTRALRRMSNGD